MEAFYPEGVHPFAKQGLKYHYLLGLCQLNEIVYLRVSIVVSTKLLLLIPFYSFKLVHRGEGMFSRLQLHIATRLFKWVIYTATNSARAFQLLYVTIYGRATPFDYFFQFLTVSHVFSVKLAICPVLYRHLRHKRSSPSNRPAARERTPHSALLRARRLNPVLAGRDVLFFERELLTAPCLSRVT